MNNLEKEYKVNEQGMIVEEIEKLIDKGLNEKTNPQHGSEPVIFKGMATKTVFENQPPEGR